MADNPRFEHACKILVIACAAAAAAGCATLHAPPPSERIAVADAAVADAASAGAPEYAAVDYRRGHVASEVSTTRARSAKAVRAAAEVQAGIRALREETVRTSR